MVYQKTNDNNGLEINQILDYLKTWIKPMELEEYVKKRQTKYNIELASIQINIEEYQSIISQPSFASLSQTIETKSGCKVWNKKY